MYRDTSKIGAILAGCSFHCLRSVVCTLVAVFTSAWDLTNFEAFYTRSPSAKVAAAWVPVSAAEG